MLSSFLRERTNTMPRTARSLSHVSVRSEANRRPTAKGVCGLGTRAIWSRWLGRAVGERKTNVRVRDIPTESARTRSWSGTRVAVRKIFGAVASRRWTRACIFSRYDSAKNDEWASSRTTRTTALFLINLSSSQHGSQAANEMYPQPCVIGKNVVGDHNHKLYRSTIGTFW